MSSRSRSVASSCHPWWRVAGFRDGSVMNARKTDGFLALTKSLLRLMTNRQKTHCGNDRKLAR